MPQSLGNGRAAGAARLRAGSRWLEIGLWSIAAACFGALLFTAFMAAGAMHAAQSIPNAAGVDRTRAGSADYGAEPAGSSAWQVQGRLEIPALRLSAPITSGVDTSNLLSGVGHVNGSALPGGLGTMVLAGHRDTYLRPLERVAKGMDIVIVDATGTFHYSVDRWEIVEPEQVEAISIRSRPELALVTCYPFHFVGAAPKRFVVHAHLVSLVPGLLR